jgi:hypothetical protein
MPAWNAFSYVFGPLAAFAVLGLLILVLKWAFGRRNSVVAAAPRVGQPDEYGLLVPVATPGTYIEGEILRRRLEDAGVRANLAHTAQGPRVLVWPQDVDRARAIAATSE